MKAGKDPLANYRNRLEDLDIKVVIPYIIGVTTHVVSTKRNTAKGLQALINGKYIVTETYIDALVYATTPENLDELESLSPLEEDFDANWPDALKHLPAKSKEPSERPSEDFAPNTQRENVFEGYTFVFLDATQFETLQAPIANGSGKALSFVPDPGKTTAEDIVRYVKSVAGEKGLGEFEDGSEGKGVVVVRFRLKENFADWAAQMDTTVSLALGQRLIEQSEFLEAILLNDASKLRRPLEVDYEESAPRTNEVVAPAASAEGVMQVETLAQPEVPKPAPRRARVRGNITSRFKGFGADDDDDESSIPTSSRPAPADSQMESAPRSGRSQRHSNGASLADSAIDIDTQNQQNGEDEATTSRKRPASALAEIDEDEMMDDLLPAATAMKRRRIEEAESSQRNGVSREPSLETFQKKAKKEKTRQPPKEVNIKDALRERREQKEKEEAARGDDENPRDAVDSISIEEMRKLAIVEFMDTPDRSGQTRRRDHHDPTDSRWDERWNGRKNFKKFRRPGEGTQARRGQSVIVPLEVVKGKDYGIGENYWVESEKTKKHKATEQVTQSHSQSQAYATAKSETVEATSELAINGDLPESIDVESPRITRRQERTQQTGESSSRSQAVNGKRPAASQASGGPAKKQKTFAVQDSDSDSEDELKFRFRKKGK